MPALLVLTDAPEEIILSEGKRISKVQIAKTGLFSDPRYGKFTIKPSDFTKWIANFNTLNKSDGRLGLPVDVDHSPEKKGETEAVGWVTSLDEKGNELWATVEWNDLGVELIENKRYAYLSPSYVANYKDEHGKEHGTALLGVGLTNRPFLTMATVSLSRLHSTERESYTPDDMSPLKTIATALKLAEDADEATILARVTELAKEPEPQSKTLADQAKAEGMFLLTAAQFASLSQNATEGAAAAAALKDQKFETTFSAALNDPKGARVLPAQKELFKGLYDNDAENTLKLLDGLPSVVAAAPTGSNGQPTNGKALSVSETEGFETDDSVELHEKAMQLCAADAKLDYGDAVIAAAEQMGL